MSKLNLSGWIPTRIVWANPDTATSAPRVEWVRIGKERLLDPFFGTTIDTVVRRPFNMLFRRQTSMEEMCEWTDENPGAPVRGLIFHVSRCGSTLISQQLAALEHNIVASEPSPLDSLLRAGFKLPNLSREVHARWCRAMVAALGQPRNGETAMYLKFDCWHIHQRELIREVFPDAPWIFLYRDPLKVMLSHQRIPAAWTVSGMLHPMVLGLDLSDWQPGELDLYRARALQHIYAGGLAVVRENPKIMLVNYSELPQAMWGKLLEHFKLSQEDIAPMAFKAQFDAKVPQMYFHGDPEMQISDSTREIVAKYLQPLYEELEAELAKQQNA